MNKKYIVRLTKAERIQLKQVIAKGKAAAYKIKHAHILLKVDADGPKMPTGQTGVMKQLLSHLVAMSIHPETFASVLLSRDLKQH